MSRMRLKVHTTQCQWGYGVSKQGVLTWQIILGHLPWETLLSEQGESNKNIANEVLYKHPYERLDGLGLSLSPLKLKNKALFKTKLKAEYFE